MRPQLYPFKHAPRTILGYRRNGAPIYAIAGASEMAPEGNTITVPATPAPTEPLPTPPATAQPVTTARMFTEAEVEEIRKQEKDKLYQRLNATDEQLKLLQKDRDDRLKAEEKARKDAEEAAERARQENLTFEQKLAEASTNWEAKFVEMGNQIAQRDALLERERQFQYLNDYKSRRIAEESDEIMPELLSFVSGTSEEEIEASIATAKEKTAAILTQVQQYQQGQQVAAQQARQQARGVGITAPPVGPMENQSEQESFTAEQIRDMPISEYVKYRDRLLGAASQQMRGRG